MLIVRIFFSNIVIALTMLMLTPSYAGMDASKTGVEYLRLIMAKNGAARITQNNNDGITETGRLIWNSTKKCMRLEMDNGTIYLYASSGLSIKEPGKDWAHVPLPNEWARMLLEPEAVIKEKKAQAHAIREGMYGLHLEEGGRFIYLFWAKDQLKGWVIGSMDQGNPVNEIAVDLEKIAPVNLPDRDWAPENSLLDIK